MANLNNSWDETLSAEFEQEYYKNLREFLKNEYRQFNVFPEMNDIFNAFKCTAFDDVRVVILGQDPYIKKGEAHGLAFSVNRGVRIPPSLVNIYKEIIDDVGGDMPSHGCLYEWTRQGVMLLNTTLSVREGQSMSHKGKGWEIFTDNVIKMLNNKSEPIVFLLWGNHAKSKQALITNENHFVLTAAHPSPLAGGAFKGCKHFSRANQFLLLNGFEPINWQIHL